MTYMNRLKERAKQLANNVRQKVEDEGGLGNIVEKTTLELSEKAGKAAGHVAKAIDGAINYEGDSLNPKDIYNAGTVDVGATAQKAREFAGKGVTHTRTAAATITDKVKTAAEDAKHYASEVNGAINDIATGPDHVVGIGNRFYWVRSHSKLEIGQVKQYLTTISAAIPPATTGRQEVLTFIADNAISTEGRLYDLWEKQKMPELKALTYIANARNTHT
jgi:hypothetical protein